jgi:hypothetical protein
MSTVDFEEQSVKGRNRGKREMHTFVDEGVGLLLVTSGRNTHPKRSGP